MNKGLPLRILYDFQGIIKACQESKFIFQIVFKISPERSRRNEKPQQIIKEVAEKI